MAGWCWHPWWEPVYLLLLLASVAFNFQVSRLIVRHRARSRALLALGITGNLGALLWFKYAGFIAINLEGVVQTPVALQSIVLPLAISFFTFQQIAFLVDCHRGVAQAHRLLDYLLFVCFFPQLIAGPIVHHQEMIPQFRQPRDAATRLSDVQVGLTVLVIGLFKKVVIADELAEVATPIFAVAEAGGTLSMQDAWAGALCYTFQLYFDFSGYCDMAIGAARLFGIRLPENFNSPYRSRSIIEFWRRWHMTLSRFLQEYLYIPLGGNRKGPRRKLVNLMLTMLLGGLWHGAGWTFVFWGGLHGTYLIVNHLWQGHGGALRTGLLGSRIYPAVSWLLCFTAVVLAWVFFRADSFAGAMHLTTALFSVPATGESALALAGSTPLGLPMLVFAMLIAFFLPNVQTWMAGQRVVLTARNIQAPRWAWQPGAGWAIATALLGGAALYKMLYMPNKVSEFIYFQF